ncbi:MAG: precorrin-8X methylmutase [Candidatus Calescibacterium sp.]|jgi:precorrin-8X/cobalt-precorrin-8 methylmutase|nr:precorrin-8X methylmutase [Candidatus Calescibacterium sp.]
MSENSGILKSPQEIERESYDIIRKLLPKDIFRNEDEYELAVRIVHATADIEIAKTLVFHPLFISEAQKAVEEGLPILVDVEMVMCGIKNYALDLSLDVVCNISSPDVVEEAKKLGITRAALSARKSLKERQFGLVVCGNSPTFLYEVIRIVNNEEDGFFLPKAIIGLPVGFVSAENVKRELTKVEKVPFLTNLSPKGGTPTAVSSTIFILNKVRAKRGKELKYGQHT